jgi:uncharacterized protein YcbK (DUF882 family)
MMSKITLDELACKCGCGRNKTHFSFLNKLNDARNRTVIQFVINSGYRCPIHNTAVGGSKNSPHMGGWAVDIATPNSRVRYYIFEALKAEGFTRFGIAKSFIHVDADPNKDEEVLWTY